MHIEQKLWTQESNWRDIIPDIQPIPQLVCVFGGRTALENVELFPQIKAHYSHPDTHIITCSTAGEITQHEVTDNSVAVTGVHFEKTKLRFVHAPISAYDESYSVGKSLATQLANPELVHVIVFSDGLKVNGTQLVKGLNDTLGTHVSVTGGLAGDGPDFKKTLIGLDSAPTDGLVVAVGLYGTSLKVGYGSLGGWDTFGLERTITKSQDNILYELDGKPALTLYKEYLGEQASGLPGTGLLFPLRLKIKSGESEVEVVRTILGVNEADQSMTFAGDMPQGVTATLMRANFERLIDGASLAGQMSIESLQSHAAEWALLISCVGRKLVLKERAEEEIEAVRSVIGESVAISGFYSYGELCPTTSTSKQCELHNQTMTITTFREE